MYQSDYSNGSGSIGRLCEELGGEVALDYQTRYFNLGMNLISKSGACR